MYPARQNEPIGQLKNPPPKKKLKSADNILLAHTIEMFETFIRNCLRKISNHLSSSFHNIASGICLLSIQIFYLLLLFLQHSTAVAQMWNKIYHSSSTDSDGNYQRKETVYISPFTYPRVSLPLCHFSTLQTLERTLDRVIQDYLQSSKVIITPPLPSECQCPIRINLHFLIIKCSEHSTLQ